MSNQAQDTGTHEQLARAVISGLLPDRAHEQAEKLLTRLETPVRLALLGMPRTGKSSILNLLIGQTVLDEGVALPTCQFVHGRMAQSICTLSDGTKTAIEGVDVDRIAALSPAFVEIRMPLAALKKISVLEVVAPADPNALHRASQWAARRCDIAIWCTHDFPADEQRIWSQMPDTMKDHALLMVTRSDLLRQQGAYDEVLGAVSAVATGEFNKIIPIATPAAIGARGPDGTVNKDAFRESGGTALISAVLRQVEQGRRTALDLAEVLLLQNETALADLDAVLAASEEEESRDTAQETARLQDDAAAQDGPEDTDPEGAQTGPEPSKAEPATMAPRPEPVMSPMRRRETPAEGRVDPTEAEKVSVGIARLRNIAARRAEAGLQASPAAELQAATRAVYEHAITQIEQKAAELADQLSDLGETAPTSVITHAVDDLNWLCDYLNTNGDDSDPALQRARDTAFDAADLVQLMQMEKRDSAAIEAVSLMLQVKREMQADLAA